MICLNVLRKTRDCNRLINRNSNVIIDESGCNL